MHEPLSNSSEANLRDQDQQPPFSAKTRDARHKASLIFIALVITTFGLGILTRAALGMFSLVTIFYLFLILFVKICFLIMGFVYYFYPPIPTLKQIFRPLDIALAAGVFLSLYLHVICFTDSSSEAGPLWFFLAVTDTTEQAVRLSQRSAMAFALVACVFWLGIALRGFLRQRAQLIALRKSMHH